VLEGQSPGADARHIEEVVDELVEALGGAAGGLDALASGVGLPEGIGLGEGAPEELELELEGREGGLQLMGGDGEEVIANLEGLLEILCEGLDLPAGEDLFGDLGAEGHGAEGFAFAAAPGLDGEVEVFDLLETGAGEVGAEGDLVTDDGFALAIDLVEEVEEVGIETGGGLADGATDGEVLADEGLPERVDELDDVLGAAGEADGDGGLHEEGFEALALGLGLEVGVVLAGEELGALMVLAEASGDIAEDDDGAEPVAEGVGDGGVGVLDGELGAAA
jgi:hypothetical protein